MIADILPCCFRAYARIARSFRTCISSKFTSPLYGLLFVCCLPATSSFCQQLPPAGSPTILSAITLSVTLKNPTCSNAIGSGGVVAGTGSITVLASGGTAPYTYAFTNSGIPQNNGYFPGLVASKYYVRVTDAAGLFKDTVLTLTNILSQPTVAVIVNLLPNTCTSANGSFSLYGNGGTPPYTYSIDGGVTYTSTNTFNNLTQGLYTFYVKDANGCMAAGSTSKEPIESNYFFSKQHCALTIHPEGAGTSCSSDGTAVVWTSNGIPPYSYSLDGINYYAAPNNGQFQFDPYEYTFTNLAPGTYTFYSKDNTGTVAVTAYTVSKSCYLDVTSSSKNTSCQKNDGELTINSNYGKAPYTYSIDGIHFQSGNVFTGLAAGNYSATVTDANGETYSKQATVYTNCPTLSLVAVNETCSGKNGIITGKVTNGTAPFQFSIDGLNYQTGNIFPGLSAGNYTVTVKDANGFSSLANVIINNICFHLLLAAIDVICGNSNGIIAVTAADGTAPYKYSIDGVHFQTSNQFDDLPAGTYTITVTDAAGLTIMASTEIKNSPGPQMLVTTSQDTCHNSGGMITIAGSGGKAPYQYSIDNGSTYQNDSAFTNLDSGNYEVLIKDASGCTIAQTVTLTVLPPPTVFIGNDTTLCTGQVLLLNVAGIPGTYLWQDGSTQASYLVDTTGTYTVSITKNACSATGSLSVSYMSKPFIPWVKDTTLCLGDLLLLNAFYPQSNCEWQDGSVQPQYSISHAGVYTVAVSNTCGVTHDTVTVSYKHCACEFYVPGAFSPNNDGMNDMFRPKRRCLTDRYRLSIFNRWGQMIFNTQNPDSGWDGTLAGKPQPEGTYVWFISYHDPIIGQSFQQQGTVVLIR